MIGCLKGNSKVGWSKKDPMVGWLNQVPMVGWLWLDPGQTELVTGLMQTSQGY